MKIISELVNSSCMEQAYIKWIQNNRYNPIKIKKLLNELNSSENSLRREWLIEVFDSARCSSETPKENEYNLGIALINCQFIGYALWREKTNQLEDAKSRTPAGESNSISFLGITIYKKLSPLEKIEKKIIIAKKQQELSLSLAHQYLDILEDIWRKRKNPYSYKTKKLETSDFILNLLFPKNSVSMLHLASFYKDDRLLSRLLILLVEILTPENAPKILILLATRFKLINKNFSAFYNYTIGHSISNKLLDLPVSFNYLINILEKLIAVGIPKSQIREFLDMPVVDVPTENMSCFINKFRTHLQTNDFGLNILSLYDNLQQFLYDDYAQRHYRAINPISSDDQREYPSPSVATAVTQPRYLYQIQSTPVEDISTGFVHCTPQVEYQPEEGDYLRQTSFLFC